MGDEKLISKKDLLTRYGISYGALYRWKRKGLIPDEWFIKRSTVTGQETFFPEALVCQRVETILEKKEEVLLDELAQALSGEAQGDEYLILQTVFGEKAFRMKDIREATFTDAKGNRIDLLAVLRGLGSQE